MEVLSPSWHRSQWRSSILCTVVNGGALAAAPLGRSAPEPPAPLALSSTPLTSSVDDFWIADEMQPPEDRYTPGKHKGTSYEGGIKVPLMIGGCSFQKLITRIAAWQISTMPKSYSSINSFS